VSVFDRTKTPRWVITVFALMFAALIAVIAATAWTVC
jgi:hypothetical protein